MRRLALVLLMTLMAFGASVQAAVPVADLSSLANYFPANAWAYVGLRTDDDFVGTLDSLFNQALAYLPENQRPPFTLHQALDNALGEAGLGTYEENIRPWLGDVAALGIWLDSSLPIEQQFSSNPLFLVAIRLTDGDAALAFFQPMLEAQVQNQELSHGTEGGFEIYVDKSAANPMVIAFGSDVLFISQSLQSLPLAGIESSLADNAVFTESPALLPESDYNVFGFVNLPAIYELIYSQEEVMAQMPGFMMNMSNAVGAMVMGGTILDDKSLTIDIAVQSDMSIVTEMGLEVYIPQAIDPAFANHIPADAPLVLLGTEPGPTVQALFNQLRALNDLLDEMGGLSSLAAASDPFMTDLEKQVVDAIDPSWAIAIASFPFAGLTGLSLETDVFPVISHNSALYLRAVKAEDFAFPVTPDLGILFEVEDNAGAAYIVERIGASAAAYDFPLPTESYGTGQALVLPSDYPALQLGMDYDNLDILLGASDGILAFGTRPAVMAALETRGGLADDATFQEASNYFLPNSQSVLYLSAEPLFALLDELALTGLVPLTGETGDAYRLASLVNSASISSSNSAEGIGRFRAVLTLSDAPREVPATGN